MCDRWTDVLSLLILQGLLIRALGAVGVLFAVLGALIAYLVGAAQLRHRQRLSAQRASDAAKEQRKRNDAKREQLGKELAELTERLQRHTAMWENHSAQPTSSTTTRNRPITRQSLRQRLPR